MSWGEDEGGSCGSWIEQREVDRKLESLRGDCYCDCEECGHQSLGNSDTFTNGKNAFCYRCHQFYCQKCFDNHDCHSKAGEELKDLRDCLIEKKDKSEFCINQAEDIIKIKRAKLKKIQLLLEQSNKELEKDSLGTNDIAKTFKILYRIREQMKKYGLTWIDEE